MYRMHRTIATLGTIALLALLVAAPVGGAQEIPVKKTIENLVGAASPPCNPDSFCTACITTCVTTCLENGGAEVTAICTIDNQHCICACQCSTPYLPLERIKL